MLGPLADAGVDGREAVIRRFWQPAFEGSPLNLAGWAKRLTGKPSIAVGSLGLTGSASDTLMGRGEAGQVDNIPLMLERLAADEFDLITIGRSLIGDARYVAKLHGGEPTKPFLRSALEKIGRANV